MPLRFFYLKILPSSIFQIDDTSHIYKSWRKTSLFNFFFLRLLFSKEVACVKESFVLLEKAPSIWRLFLCIERKGRPPRKIQQKKPVSNQELKEYSAKLIYVLSSSFFNLFVPIGLEKMTKEHLNRKRFDFRRWGFFAHFIFE